FFPLSLWGFFLWFCEGKELENSPDIQILSGGPLHSLIIAEAFEEDTGRYSCFASNFYGTDSTSAEIYVEEPAEELSSPTQAAPEPIVPAQIPTESPPIPDLSAQSHSGQQVSDGRPVMAAPVFTQNLQDLAASQGQLVVLECRVKGVPAPKVDWFREGKVLEDSPDFRILHKKDICTLVIAEVFAEDSGMFTCIASNKYGTVSSSAALKVKGKNPTTLVQKTSKHQNQSGAAVSLPDPPTNSCLKTGALNNHKDPRSGSRVGLRVHFKLPEDEEGDSSSDSEEDPLLASAGKEPPPVLAKPKLDPSQLQLLHNQVLLEQQQETQSQPRTPTRPPLQPPSPLQPELQSPPESLMWSPRMQREPQVPVFQSVLSPPPQISGPPPPTSTPASAPTLTATASPPFKPSPAPPLSFLHAPHVKTSPIPPPFSPTRVLKSPTSPPSLVSSPTPASFLNSMSSSRAQSPPQASSPTLSSSTPSPIQNPVAFLSSVLPSLTPSQPTNSMGNPGAAGISFMQSLLLQEYKVSNFEQRLMSEIEFRLERTPVEESDEEVQHDDVPSGRCIAPIFDKKLKNFKAVEGVPVTFSCKVVGVPPPKVYWFKDGKQILRKNTHYKKMRVGDGTCALHIESTTSDDDGNYTVMVANPQGRISCSGHLIVQSGPPQHRLAPLHPQRVRSRVQEVEGEQMQERFFRPHFLQAPGDMMAHEGRLCRLDCKVSGLPSPELMWLVNGKPIYPDLTHKMLVRENSVHSLVIDPLMQNDEGTYTCIASNKAGQSSFSLELKVVGKETKHAPQFVEKLQNMGIPEGSPVRLECRVVGMPPPRIFWKKDNETVAKAKDRISMTQDATGYVCLLIQTTGRDDAGWYTVSAKNEAGVVSCTCRLDIYAQWHQSVPPPMRRTPRTGSRYAALMGQGLDVKSAFPTSDTSPILFASSPPEATLESEEL
uniref:Myopalladin n=1 Tax=Oryzias latipes TaxID=8090 RepID=A0A3P9IHN6_ORYLA